MKWIETIGRGGSFTESPEYIGGDLRLMGFASGTPVSNWRGWSGVDYGNDIDSLVVDESRVRLLAQNCTNPDHKYFCEYLLLNLEPFDKWSTPANKPKAQQIIATIKDERHDLKVGIYGFANAQSFAGDIPGRSILNMLDFISLPGYIWNHGNDVNRLIDETRVEANRLKAISIYDSIEIFKTVMPRTKVQDVYDIMDDVQWKAILEGLAGIPELEAIVFWDGEGEDKGYRTPEGEAIMQITEDVFF